MKLTAEEKAGLVMAAVMLFIVALVFYAGILAALGWVVALAWNAWLVPAVEGLPVICWWQAALGLALIRAVIQLLKD
ncbi:MAG: hypothetical protein DRH04_09380 [Deltaproteobacteria bacterium]|nr:MAG: hypothetical protein DRH04_09380 [Deltaproteobacteria bacterium]